VAKQLMLLCPIAMNDRSANGLVELSDAEAARFLEGNLARELFDGEPTPEQRAGLVRLPSADDVESKVEPRSAEETDPEASDVDQPTAEPEPEKAPTEPEPTPPSPKRRAKP
jgi:hypothetical protein